MRPHLATIAFLCLATIGIALSSPAHASGLAWSRLLGGGGTDYCYAMTGDASGDVVVAGSTTSTNYPTTSGAAQRALAGGNDMAITKLTPGGTVIWSTYLGGTADDYARGVALGPDGDVYVIGYTTSRAFPVTAGAWRTTFCGGNTDGVVARLSAATGALVYATYVGGSWDDYPRGIAVDPSGCALVGGYTTSGDFPTTPGVVKTSFAPNLYDPSDAFVLKLAANGSGVAWSTFLGGGGADAVMAVVLDASGCPVLTGWTKSTGFPTTAGAFDRTLTSNSKAFVTRLNATATGFLASTLLGGNGFDEGHDLAIDASGTCYVAGSTTSTDFPTTAGAPQRTLGAMYVKDAFVAKVSRDCTTLVWGTYLGGTAEDDAQGIALTADGGVAVVGTTSSTGFPTTAGAYRTSLAGGADAFCTLVNSTGTQWRYSTYLGSSGTDNGYGVVVQPSGCVVTGGLTDNTAFPTASRVQDPEQINAGVTDIFVSSLDVNGGSTAVGDEPIAAGALRLGPNPFRTTTTVRLTLPQRERMHVRVLDLQGRVVRELGDSEMGAGTHELAWDGRDDLGNDAGVGVFFVQATGARGLLSGTVVRLH